MHPQVQQTIWQLNAGIIKVKPNIHTYIMHTIDPSLFAGFREHIIRKIDNTWALSEQPL